MLIFYSTHFLSLLESAEPDCLNVVVGTKLDLLSADNRHSQTTATEQKSADNQTTKTRVPVERGIAFAREMNKNRHFETDVPYFETSSLATINVDEVFEYIFKTLLPLGPGVDVRKTRSGSLLDLNDAKTKEQPQPKKKCC